MPLAATEQLGLGPFPQPRREPVSKLKSLTLSSTTLYAALDTIGRTGVQIVILLSWHGGSVSSETLSAETPGSDPGDVDEAIARLVAAGLVTRSGSGHLGLVDPVADALGPIGVSFADQNAVTSDELGQVCLVLGIRPAPTRKQERIDAIAEHLSTPETGRTVLSGLSGRARVLLGEIADATGPRVIDARSIGLGRIGLHRASTPKYAYARGRERVPDEVAPLAELTAHGIVGLDSWAEELWIWREAWPLLERPLHPHWPSVPVPATGRLEGAELRVPPVVGLAERALEHWDQTPPAVLKSGDCRLAKGVVRSTSKAVGTDEATVAIIAMTMLSMGLLLPNVVKTTGRGRNRRVDEVWLADPELRAAWSAASAPTRWLRMVAEWINPQMTGSGQLVANRHLLLWELGKLDDGVGWVEDAAVTRWMEHRYASIAVDEAMVECLRDLRALGIVTAEGPVGLSALGRLALDDPAAVERADLGSADTAIVQADETIICPPDLDADLMVRLGQIAALESDTGARIFRLDETLITKAVQRGDSPEEIVAFLDGLSSVALPDTVRTLVADAAGRANRIRVIDTSTVVVAEDPVDLAAACKVKSAKLTLVSDTVAVSPLAADKIRRVLDRKGLTPTLVTRTGDGVVPRRSSDDAAELERAARRQRELAARHGIAGLARQPDRFDQQASAASNPASKLTVKGPLAVTPALLERLRS